MIHDPERLAAERAQRRIELMHRALRASGRTIGRATVEQAYSAMWEWLQDSYWVHDLDPGFDAQLEWLGRQFEISGRDDALLNQLRRAYLEPIFELPPLPVDNALAIVEGLRRAGMPLGLICNTSVTPGFALRRLLSGYGLDQLFSVQLYSDEIGCRKPAAEVFRQAAARLGVDVATLLHVGDQVQADIAGATAAGANGLLVNIIEEDRAAEDGLAPRLAMRAAPLPTGQAAPLHQGLVLQEV